MVATIRCWPLAPPRRCHAGLSAEADLTTVACPLMSGVGEKGVGPCLTETLGPASEGLGAEWPGPEVRWSPLTRDAADDADAGCTAPVESEAVAVGAVRVAMSSARALPALAFIPGSSR